MTPSLFFWVPQPRARPTLLPPSAGPHSSAACAPAATPAYRPASLPPIERSRGARVPQNSSRLPLRRPRAPSLPRSRPSAAPLPPPFGRLQRQQPRLRAQPRPASRERVLQEALPVRLVFLRGDGAGLAGNVEPGGDDVEEVGGGGGEGESEGAEGGEAGVEEGAFGLALRRPRKGWQSGRESWRDPANGAGIRHTRASKSFASTFHWASLSRPRQRRWPAARLADTFSRRRGSPATQINQNKANRRTSAPGLATRPHRGAHLPRFGLAAAKHSRTASHCRTHA